MKVALFVLLAWLPGLVSAVCERPLIVAAEHWPPYAEKVDERWTGIDVQQVRAILAAVGCEAVFTDIPPERSHLLLERGEIDLLMAASDVPARHRYAWFTLPYRQEVQAVFAISGTKDLPSDFFGFRDSELTLIAPRAGWYGDDYAAVRDELMASDRLLTFDYTRQALTMLAAGRGHLVMGDQQSMLLVAQQMKLSIEQRWVANDAPVHLMLSRHSVSEALVQRINEVLTSKAQP
ncbi:MAG: hypothetical protein CVV10_09365 [Gammaproteobacteria bacterium HGW-Gammaproteobacteria-14]|nr:MAG: hypothetical protein CVV10_09365 [Gammaproteobacteria bacterium HGW-Gammaproteobacteria-14]